MPITITTLLSDLGAMRPGSFYPTTARAQARPYLERHSVAGGDWAYTLWHDDVPIVPNLDATWQASDAYIEYLISLGEPSPVFPDDYEDH